MHEKYTTRGLVVSSSAYREADKIISIYTEDFGLISAVATGVRNPHSKLRYHVQDHSIRNFSLVRGRDLWRLVGAEEVFESESEDKPSEKLAGENLAAYARVLSLIRRLVKGEEKNPAVFLTLFSLRDLLAEGDPIVDLLSLETLAVFKILHALGYVQSDSSTHDLVALPEITLDQVDSAKPLAPKLISAINKGLTESHL